MAQKKQTKKTKVSDLKPKKDAKGGVIAIIKPAQQGPGNPNPAQAHGASGGSGAG